MSFFPNASGFVLNGGSYTDIAGDFNLNMIAQDLSDDLKKSINGVTKRRGKKRDHDFPIIKRKHIDLGEELGRGLGHRIHSGKHKGRAVIVKVFSGPHSEKRCAASAAFARHLFHSNIAQILGVSLPTKTNYVGPNYIVYHGVKGVKRMPLLIATALRTSLPRSVYLSLKMIKGLAAGLSYVHSENISLHRLLGTNGGLDNFDLLTGENDEPVLFLNAHIPEPAVSANDFRSPMNISEDDDWGLFNGISEKTFQEANRIVYNDLPERTIFDLDRHCFDDSNLPLEINRTSNGVPDGISDMNGTVEKGAEAPPPEPRRELRWIDMSTRNQTLELVYRQYEEHIDNSFTSYDFSSTSSANNIPLRRLRREIGSRRRTGKKHTCSLTYLREEIALSTDLSRSAIVAHTTPDLHEKCLRCGELFEDNTWAVSTDFSADFITESLDEFPDNNFPTPPTIDNANLEDIPLFPYSDTPPVRMDLDPLSSPGDTDESQSSDFLNTRDMDDLGDELLSSHADISPRFPELSDSSKLSSLARSKLKLTGGIQSKDSNILHRWVLLKNSVIQSPPMTTSAPEPHRVNPKDGLDDNKEGTSEVLDSVEHDSFMFPDAGKLTGSQSADEKASEAQWLTSVLETLGDDDNLPLEAPIEWKYTTPSSSSRKDIPAEFSRKRRRLQAFDEEKDELPKRSEPPPNASDEEVIEWKRHLNTIAARRSRQRKREFQQTRKLENGGQEGTFGGFSGL